MQSWTFLGQISDRGSRHIGGSTGGENLQSVHNSSQVEVRTWKTLTEEEKLNVEISENKVRKDFSKVERESAYQRIVEARMAGPIGPTSKHDVQDQVAKELGASRTAMRRGSAIVKNKDLISAEDSANWDEGKLSTNKIHPLPH